MENRYNQKIRQIGGNVNKYYERICNIVNEMDWRCFDLLKQLDLIGDLDLYLKLASTDYEGDIKKAYIEQAKINNPDISGTSISITYGNRFKVIFKDYENRFYSTHFNYDVLDVFKEAFILDTKKGLIIDKRKFVNIFYERTKATESKIYEKHTKACEAVNAFFNGVKITDEEIIRYFRVHNGLLVPNEENVKISEYMRLI